MDFEEFGAETINIVNGLNRLSASVRIWTLGFVDATGKYQISSLNRLSASVRIWTATSGAIGLVTPFLSVLIAFRLQSEFGQWSEKDDEELAAMPSLNRLSASVRIWTTELSLIVKYKAFEKS